MKQGIWRRPMEEQINTREDDFLGYGPRVSLPLQPESAKDFSIKHFFPATHDEMFMNIGNMFISF